MPRTVTRTGSVVITAPANDNVPEWRLQAAAVRRLRARPDFGVRFALAGDMNAARRGKQTATVAKATGMTAGEPDLRLYAEAGRLLLVEYKAGKGRLSQDQRDRHALLTRLGYAVHVVRATTEADCADQTEALLDAWLEGGTALAACA